MMSNGSNNDKGADATCEMALWLYSRARKFVASDNIRVANEARVLALLLAATWMGQEELRGPPWAPLFALPPAPRVSREAFLGWAASIWDRWAEVRSDRSYVRPPTDWEV